ncbi:BgTH12-06048 [Blumeria graminis f. sp. triticale]|uniref:BgTH12-06048 n=1 Tax=Blumeria graminis f. sp. triticale TaxID=1689686 RepID=A0A9W4D9E0_BLUGR|nr:BgTH12-06048 [Blumeria graminis f. sp. triticale]
MDINFNDNLLNPLDENSTHDIEVDTSSNFSHIQNRRISNPNNSFTIFYNSSDGRQEQPDPGIDIPSNMDLGSGDSTTLATIFPHDQNLNSEIEMSDARIIDFNYETSIQNAPVQPNERNRLHGNRNNHLFELNQEPDIDIHTQQEIYPESWAATNQEIHLENRVIGNLATSVVNEPPNYVNTRNQQILSQIDELSEEYFPFEIPLAPLSYPLNDSIVASESNLHLNRLLLAGRFPTRAPRTFDRNCPSDLWTMLDNNSRSILATTQSHYVSLANSSLSPNREAITLSGNDESDYSDSRSIDENYEPPEHRNLDLYGTLKHWSNLASRKKSRRSKPYRGPSLPAVEALRSTKPCTVERCDLRGEYCDAQSINWRELNVSREEAQDRRCEFYHSYGNVRYRDPMTLFTVGSYLPNRANYFKFRRMDFQHNVHLIHFQLRNLIACPTRDHVFYVGRSKIMHYNPVQGKNDPKPSTVLDLCNPHSQSGLGSSQGIQISTMAVGHNFLIAGGFCGEYGLLNLQAQKGTEHIQGFISKHQNSIVNHIQIHTTRRNAHPFATFATNHASLRILDINTNKLVSEQTFNHALNCSAISPDQRLRVMVGDMREVLICNSETGAILQTLQGHYDYGFACDWADDGVTVATGNQDRQIRIWDARKWTTSKGLAYPVAQVACKMSGVRKLKFSPLGSGKRLLVAAQAADYIHVIDAGSFKEQQDLSFFGEISGFDFANDGQDLFVAISDQARGGIMEFERCDIAGGGSYDLKCGFRGREDADCVKSFDWMSDDQIARVTRSHVTPESLDRQAASYGISKEYF